MKACGYIASFDSASAMLRAISRFLHGKDFPMLGLRSPTATRIVQPIAATINTLPRSVREQLYIRSSGREAVAPEKLGRFSAEAASRWIVRQYPQRQYPAIAIGSSNGAWVHLCAALGIPWLPQTLLIPVARTGIHLDEIVQDMEWAHEPARGLLDANPDLILHHMHDANQDRLTIQRLTYFRVKRTRLGATFERFLAQHLAPGGTIFLVECQATWPTTRVGERYVFQHGAIGGATADEYLHGSERVASFLARYGSPYRRWPSPEPDGVSPEAERGFEPALRADVERVADEQGYRVCRVVFDHPEQMSPLVADLYRWWYAQRGLPTNRLLGESFILIEPYWTFRTGSVPYWTVFATQPSVDSLMHYLDGVAGYDDIFSMLFSHGTDSIGLAPIERWRSILGRAARRSSFIGVDVQAFPRDFATFVNYYLDLKRRVAARYPLPAPLTLGQLGTFLSLAGDRYQVQWVEDMAARA